MTARATDPDSLALRNLRWLAEYRRKKATCFPALDPRTLAERHRFELRQAVKVAQIRHWHRAEQMLRWRRVPPPYVAPAKVIPFRMRPRISHPRSVL